MAEGVVVGDDVGLRPRHNLLILDDTLQMGPCVAGVAAVPVLLNQALFDALPGAAELLEVQIWSNATERKLVNLTEKCLRT